MHFFPSISTAGATDAYVHAQNIRLQPFELSFREPSSPPLVSISHVLSCVLEPSYSEKPNKKIAELVGTRHLDLFIHICQLFEQRQAEPSLRSPFT